MYTRPFAHLLLSAVLLFALAGCAGGSAAGPGSADPPAASAPSPQHSFSGEEQVPDTATTAQFPAAAAHANAVLTYAVIDAPNGTFGYDVFSDGQLLLHQTNVPGQPGVEGCKTKADAEKVAAFVIEKVKNGQMPPTVETDELKSLGIIH